MKRLYHRLLWTRKPGLHQMLRSDRPKRSASSSGASKKAFDSRKAARWLQVENRVGLLIDLKITSELPLLD
jgi:hypothetical protein